MSDFEEPLSDEEKVNANSFFYCNYNGIPIRTQHFTNSLKQYPRSLVHLRDILAE